jgi:hypothetical protein
LSSESDTSTALQGQYFGKARLERLLAHWIPTPEQPAATVYIRPGEAQQFLEASGPEGRSWLEHLSALGRAVTNSDTGITGLRTGAEGLVILPPFPILENRLIPIWDGSPLLALLEADYTVGVILLRLGRYAVAVYLGSRLISSKTDTRYVKGRHRAGGSSQRRFERIREGQIRQIYDKTCEVVQSQFAPYARQLDYIVMGGERLTLIGFLKACPYLQQFLGIILSRRLNIQEPKRDTLEAVGEMLLESRVFQFQWR